MKNLLFVLLLLNFAVSYCQNYFNKKYINDFSNLSSSIVKNENGYFVLGQEVSSNYRKIVIYNINNSGELISVKKSETNLKLFYASKLEVINDNFYVFGAISDSLVSDNFDLFLASYDMEMNLHWLKRYGGSNFDNAYDLTISSDNNLLLTGSKSPEGADPYENFYLLKVDLEGNVMWEKTYGVDNALNYCVGRSLTPTSDGGYALVWLRLDTASTGDKWHYHFWKL